MLISDLAYAKMTRQSSAVQEPYSGWMYATTSEKEPWWEIDLHNSSFIERITVWIAKLTPGVELTLWIHAIHTRFGLPAEGAFQHCVSLDDLPIAADGSAVLQIMPDTVGRYVRISLRMRDGSPAMLLVRGAEVLGIPIFAETLYRSYQRAFSLFADRPLFSSRKTQGEGPFVVTHHFRDVWLAARRLASALASHLEPGSNDERVFLGICTKNRPEWIISDLAAIMRGYVVAPLSPDDPEERLATIASRCPFSALIVDGDVHKFVRLKEKCPSLRLIVSCDAEPTALGVLPGFVCTSFAVMMTLGAARDAPPAITRDEKELYSLGFTSGSSGVPKGAMRSSATFHAMLQSYGITQPTVHCSFQPLSHLSERMYMPAIIIQGGLIGFSGGGAHLLSDLQALEPTSLGSVPRLYELVLANHKRRLAALVDAEPETSMQDLEARVFAESRFVFGSRLQALGVGSAPVSPEVNAFLRHCFADLWVAEGYGSTECGTITHDGQISPQVAVKLVPVSGLEQETTERGEIWVKTPHLIDGYFGDAASTSAALDADGYFRTGDLGERTSDGRVRVVGRVNNVVKLGQGEFVAVDRIEAELANCPLVDQIFVHPDHSFSALYAVVVPAIESLGRALGLSEPFDREVARHPDAAAVIVRALGEHGRRMGLASYEVPRAVLVEAESMTVESGLLTASGKLSRPAAIQRYAKALDALGKTSTEMLAGDSLVDRLAVVVSDIVKQKVSPDDPLHEGLGIDSLTASEVMSAVGNVVGQKLPLAFWFESRTLVDLAKRLDRGILSVAKAPEDQALRDVELWQVALKSEYAMPRLPFETILLTGATGFLGAHLLEALVARTSARVVCLVRAASEDAGAKRVVETLSRYAIPVPDPSRWQAMSADLAAPALGLTEAQWCDLAERVDVIVHAGAAVNWLQSYGLLRASNVLGTVELLKLATLARDKPLHFVSTISTAEADGDESSKLSYAHARAASGYGLSKWVAEEIVRRAGEAGHPVAIYRPSMITGHSKRGIGNASDYVNRYLSACVQFGKFLDVADERMDMTPVDFVANGITELLLARPAEGSTYHLTNIEQSMSYRDLGLSLVRAGIPCSPCDYPAFRSLALAEGSPLRALASYFPESGFVMRMGPWPSARSQAALLELGVFCPPVDERLIAAYVRGL